MNFNVRGHFTLEGTKLNVKVLTITLTRVKIQTVRKKKTVYKYVQTIGKKKTQKKNNNLNNST